MEIYKAKYILTIVVAVVTLICNSAYGQAIHEMGFDCLLPEESDQIVNANQWQLKGKIKNVLFIKYSGNQDLPDRYNIKTLDKLELEKSIKKIDIDSSSINAVSYSFLPMGKLNNIYSVNLENKDFSNRVFFVNQIPFVGYSYIDTSRTLYKFNSSGQIVEILNTDTFELRKYDINNNLISDETGINKNLLTRKITTNKNEYRNYKDKMEIFQTTPLEIYPIKTNDIFFKNKNKIREISYNIFNGDTSYIKTFVYNDKLNAKLVETTLSLKVMANEYYVYKTKYSYNSEDKIIEEITYLNNIPNNKVTFAYDKEGILIDKTNYNFDNKKLNDWKLSSIELNFYINRDNLKNPTKIVSLKGVMQYDNKIDYEVIELIDIVYEYYD